VGAPPNLHYSSTGKEISNYIKFKKKKKKVSCNTSNSVKGVRKIDFIFFSSTPEKNLTFSVYSHIIIIIILLTSFFVS